jgi:Transglycosylase SLT domain
VANPPEIAVDVTGLVQASCPRSARAPRGGTTPLGGIYLRLPQRTRGIIAGLFVLLMAPIFTVVARSHLAAATVSQPVSYIAPASATVLERSIKPLPVHDPQVGLPDPTATPALPVLSPPPRPPKLPHPATTPAAALGLPIGPPPAPGSIEAIIRDAASRHGVSPDWMVKIARCESGLRPHAFNPVGPYYGIFQFLMSTFRAHGGTDIWDPYQQAEITATMLSHGGARAWGCA